jgi:hypothetical protein
MHSNKYGLICKFAHRLALCVEMASFMAIETMLLAPLAKVLQISANGSVLVDARHRAPFLLNVK